MNRIKVLFFSADPLSVPQPGARPRLRVDEEMREIKQKIRAAEHRHALEFDVRDAARTDDLLQAFNETHPRIVHFSGHGGSEGLIFASRYGNTGHPVNGQALARLFEIFRGEIGVVVLSACHSRPQAEAIADVIGCAIGTRNTISDEAAITFGASFYRAVAFGHSVQTAFDQARLALQLDHFGEHEYPELIVGKGFDPADVVLVSPPDEQVPVRENQRDPAPAGPAPVDEAPRDAVREGRSMPNPLAKRFVTVIAALALSSGAVYAIEQSSAPKASEMPINSLLSSSPTAAETGITLYEAGKFDAAYPHLERAANAGDAEAMAYLGAAYLWGQGVARQPDLGIVWIERARDEGNPRGMNALALAYQLGEGKDQSDRWAEYWFRKAAETRNHVPAMRNLGGMLVQDGTDSAYAEAVSWFRRAADAGDADAMADLARMFGHGWGVPMDADSVRWWHQRAAENGSPKGILGMGWLHERAGDDAAARQWYARGQDVGAGDAMNNLGVLYYEGRGGNRSRREAIRWFRRAAHAGSAMAQANLTALGVD